MCIRDRQSKVQNLLGLGGNGGIAHVANTQMTKIANGTTSSTSPRTTAKIATTLGSNTVVPSAMRVFNGSQVPAISDNLPEASLACAGSTRECGQ